jgi:RHS repeat-associated protein
VFFDDLAVTHHKGPLTEETHYYPFGLTMAGISSKVIGPIENRYKFNEGSELESKEFSDGSGLDLYATEFRSYDPQIGRFLLIDPLVEFNVSWTPYNYCNNNPIIFNDPLGLDTVGVVGKVSQLPATPGQEVKLINTNGGTSSYIYDPKNPNADENGLVENGMTDPAEETVTVVHKKENSENNADQNETNKSRPGFNLDNAITALNRNAVCKSQGACARYVRTALEAAGINTTGRPVSAKDYAPFLQKKGFQIVGINIKDYAPRRGDIAVMKSFVAETKAHPHGHIEMYNGKQWVSDFKQNSFWPGSDYRIFKPDFTILRW